ncbi:MAG: M15 family metallopeptidase [Lachnospiraceae bacterium]|nr:M15 family metallopeptidase [Lachnospiraceae bacterium]
MKKHKSIPKRKYRKYNKYQIRIRLLPHIVLIAGCFAVIVSITGNAFGKESVPDVITASEIIPDNTIPESPAARIDNPPNGTESLETQRTAAPWHLILINAQNSLPDDYMDHPIDLVNVPGGEKVDARIYKPLMEMLEDAEGLGAVVVSGYRTPEKQQSLYDDKIKEYKKQGYPENEAIELAQQWVAKPGTSEHQLGLAVDINGDNYDIYLWLQENSYKYGFIFRYPGNKTHITNVAEEVWHYRYVGKEAATEIHERGICLEEYLDSSQIQDSNEQGSQDQESNSQETPAQNETSYELRNGEWVVIDTSYQ